MSYAEKNFQSELASREKPKGCLELKIVKPRTATEKPFAFSQISHKQMQTLVDVNGERGYYYKLSDLDPTQKGFDCFYMNKTPAYLVVMYYYPRHCKNVYYIHIQDLLKLIERKHPKKSATEDELIKHSTFIDDYTEKNKLKQLKQVPSWQNTPQEKYNKITKHIKLHK